MELQTFIDKQKIVLPTAEVPEEIVPVVYTEAKLAEVYAKIKNVPANNGFTAIAMSTKVDKATVKKLHSLYLKKIGELQAVALAEKIEAEKEVAEEPVIPKE